MPLLMCDLDDTLVDRGLQFDRWAATFCEQHGLDSAVIPSLAVLDAGGNLPRQAFFTALCERFGLTDDVADLVEGWSSSFPDGYRCTTEVLEALAAARSAGWRVAIVTNGEQRVQSAKIRAAGLDERVDAICISGEVGVRKPEAGMFEVAAERAGAGLEGAWMIGDNAAADIAGAAALGVRTVWIGRAEDWPLPEVTPTACAPTADLAISLVLTSP